MPQRATVFIDGNNWYHSLRDAGALNLADLNYAKISRKLLGPRDWVSTRYYIGQVQQHTNTQLYADQRKFLASLQATDSRITCHLGRLESHPERNDAADELLHYLHSLTVRIDSRVFHELIVLAKRHQTIMVTTEKAVDVMLAVDMVLMAQRGEYDAAYLLSADGDFTPAVAAVRGFGRKVYAASPSQGAQLGAVVDAYIRLDRGWFQDCYGP
ncbi:MAG: NYN domain-containing protein [Gemmatimonadetes bacterium]|nr:NYN domain-containing protein [Gemmatimonadota bacterium]